MTPSERLTTSVLIAAIVALAFVAGQQFERHTQKRKCVNQYITEVVEQLYSNTKVCR